MNKGRTTQTPTTEMIYEAAFSAPGFAAITRLINILGSTYLFLVATAYVISYSRFFDFATPILLLAAFVKHIPRVEFDYSHVLARRGLEFASHVAKFYLISGALTLVGLATYIVAAINIFWRFKHFERRYLPEIPVQLLGKLLMILMTVVVYMLSSISLFAAIMAATVCMTMIPCVCSGFLCVVHLPCAVWDY